NEPLSALVGARVMSEAAKLSANNFEMDTDTEAYKELVEQARSIDTNEALGNIEIAGSFDNLPFEYSEAELRFFLLRYIPPLALKTVKRIEFCPITDEDHAGHGGSAGLHIRYSGYSTIVISNEDPVETYE